MDNAAGQDGVTLNFHQSRGMQICYYVILYIIIMFYYYYILLYVLYIYIYIIICYNTIINGRWSPKTGDFTCQNY